MGAEKPEAGIDCGPPHRWDAVEERVDVILRCFVA